MLIAPSEEGDVDMPMSLRDNIKAIKAVNRELSRKQNQSKNYCRAKRKLAKLHKKAANQRSARHWQLAYDLCNKYATICLETLNLKFMQIGHGKKVSDYGYGNFLLILEYVASRCGTTIVKVDKWYPSSQLCHECGFQNKEIKNLQIREWDCPNCGEHLDRDRNAAKNILREGLRIFSAA